jgi:MFS family permease
LYRYAAGCLNFVSAAGAIGGGVLYNRHGAVKCVRIAVVLYAVGMLLIAAAYSFAQVFAGRVVCGLGVGLGFAICPQYIAEISPPAWRGVLVSMFEISINLGLCGGYVAGLYKLNPVVTHSLKAPGFKPWALKMRFHGLKICFQIRLVPLQRGKPVLGVPGRLPQVAGADAGAVAPHRGGGAGDGAAAAGEPALADEPGR